LLWNKLELVKIDSTNLNKTMKAICWQ